MTDWIINLAILAGASFVLVGLAQMYPPAAWIVCGLMLLAMAFALNDHARKRKEVASERSPTSGNQLEPDK